MFVVQYPSQCCGAAAQRKPLVVISNLAYSFPEGMRWALKPSGRGFYDLMRPQSSCFGHQSKCHVWRRKHCIDREICKSCWRQHHAVGTPGRSSECKKSGGNPNGVCKAPVTLEKISFPARQWSSRNGVKTMLMSLSGQVRSQSSWEFVGGLEKRVVNSQSPCKLTAFCRDEWGQQWPDVQSW